MIKINRSSVFEARSLSEFCRQSFTVGRWFTAKACNICKEAAVIFQTRKDWDSRGNKNEENQRKDREKIREREIERERDKFV